MSLSDHGFIRSVTLRREDVEDFDAYPFSIPAVRGLHTLELDPGAQVDELDQGGPPLLPAYGGRSLHEQSHGESFLALATNRFGPGGLYLLDEPEAALSIPGSLALLECMRELVEQGSQFVVATHSPILTGYPGALIYLLTPGGSSRSSGRRPSTTGSRAPSSRTGSGSSGTCSRRSARPTRTVGSEGPRRERRRHGGSRRDSRAVHGASDGDRGYAPTGGTPPPRAS